MKIYWFILLAVASFVVSENAFAQDTISPAAKNAYVQTSKEPQEPPAELYTHTRFSITASSIVGFLLVAGTGILLLLITPICRDLSYDPNTGLLRPVKERPFSYARMQAWWWSVLILSCFVSFYVYTDKLLSFPPSMVVLLGGAFTVTLFGKVIDNSQLQANKVNGMAFRHQDMEPSQGIIIDILSDDAGISLHRFQSLVFNLVFGIAMLSFYFTAISNSKFPFIDFNQLQLAMLGMSAGAYVGFKVNENPDATKSERLKEVINK